MKKLLLTLFALLALTATAQTPEVGKVYTILSKQYAGMYISEEADGSLVVAALDNARRQFWEFVPAGAANTFYIRNKVSGNYIQSCNLTPSSNSKISTGTTAVAYYVGVCQSGSNAGYLWFSSTDCANYSDQSQTPRGLNKDGASSSVITWNAGTGNNGSHWSIQETEYAYEIQPFTPSAAVGQPGSLYHLVHGGQYAAADGTLAAASEDAALSWYFVGTANAAGGYQIVNAATDTPATATDGTDRWMVYEDLTDGTAYYFAAATDATDRFTAGGESLFTFKTARSAFARHAQIYDLPCGATSNGMYVSAASITGPAAKHTLTYPIRTQSGVVKSSTLQTVAPTTWYKLNVVDQADLRQGRDFDLALTLSKAPTGSELVCAYFDWDRDGVFDTAVPLEAERNITATVSVPATAKVGRSRMRVRVTYNGLADAEDEVQGQCIDFALNIIEDDGGTDFTVTARPNDPTRGSVEVRNDTVVATAFGKSTFICWKEGRRYIGVAKNLRLTSTIWNHDLNLTGIFSADASDPYGEDVLSGIDPATVEDVTEAVEINVGSREIRVKTGGTLYGVRLYDTDGRLVRHSRQSVVSTDGLAPGTYIVKAVTAKSGKTVKVRVK
ncbi:MAG: T9SS type A sorting domain-containing protein [Bacteroidaceae bacterium]|nr:T9SS type A sorting domain-containing protein [Bacteroidaceae bacterium]